MGTKAKKRRMHVLLGLRCGSIVVRLAAKSGTGFAGCGSRLAPRGEYRNDKATGSWGAYVPDLRGVIACDSREEVEFLIREAVEFHVEGFRAEGLAVPAPASWAGTPEIAAA